MKKTLKKIVAVAVSLTMFSAFSISVSAETSESTVDKSGYSFNVGYQKIQKLLEFFKMLPEDATKEEIEALFEKYGIGNGWVNGEYDESIKESYGFMVGQKNGAQYSSDDDDEEFEAAKSNYSYMTGRKNYEENYANYTK